MQNTNAKFNIQNAKWKIQNVKWKIQKHNAKCIFFLSKESFAGKKNPKKFTK